MSVLAQLFVANLKAASVEQLLQSIRSAAMPETKKLAQDELDRRGVQTGEYLLFQA